MSHSLQPKLKSNAVYHVVMMMKVLIAEFGVNKLLPKGFFSKKINIPKHFSFFQTFCSLFQKYLVYILYNWYHMVSVIFDPVK